MNEEKTPITFYVDPKKAETLDLALAILGMEKNELFEDYLGMMITRALSSKQGGNAITNEEDCLSEEIIRSRIYSWAKRCDSNPHIIVKCYFLVADILCEDKAYKSKMEGHFNDLTGEPAGSRKFDAFFRQMCSKARRAYGNVFLYNRHNGDVTLNPIYKETVLFLKEDFLR